MWSLLFPVVLALNPQKVKYAVNCGGEEVTTYDGVTYASDKGFSGGRPDNYGASAEIKFTKTPELYNTERWATEDFSYSIPIKEAGDYILILKFSEVYFNSEQEKIFSVAIGDVTVVQALDIYAKVGKNTAYDEFIPLKYENKKIIINGQEATKVGPDGTFSVDFLKSEIDNPKVNAIVLFKGKLEETNFNEQKRELDRRRASERKNKSKESSRNEEDEERYRPEEPVKKVVEDEHDFEDLIPSRSGRTIVVDDDVSIFSVFTTTPALVVIGILLVLGVFACVPSTNIQKKSEPEASESKKKPKRN